MRRLVVALFCVHPLVWVLSRRLEATAEEVCDDYVVHLGGDRLCYAAHLLEFAGRALPPAPLAGVRMVALRSMLAGRVVRILDSSRSLSTTISKRAGAAIVFTGVGGTVLVGLLQIGGASRAAAEQAATTKAGQHGQTIRGQVVGPDGKPVPTATVIAAPATRRHRDR